MAQEIDNAHSIPVDQTARNVISPGYHFEPRALLNTSVVHSRDPLPMVQPKNNIERQMIGVQRGRLKVIGVSGLKGRFVVICACGSYEHRTGKALRKLNNEKDACAVCRLIAQRRRDAHWRQTGQEKGQEDFL
jgi:hypothetical protein